MPFGEEGTTLEVRGLGDRGCGGSWVFWGVYWELNAGAVFTIDLEIAAQCRWIKSLVR